MGEVKPIDIEAELANDNAKNPRATKVVLAMLADALRVYVEAADNVRRHGAIVSHPRTGAPLENPYLKIMQAQSKTVAQAHGIKADRVFSLLRAQVEAQP